MTDSPPLHPASEPVEAPSAVTAALPPLTDRVNQGLRAIRGQMLWNSFRTRLGNSRFRIMLIVVLSVIFWIGLFVIFFFGFMILRSYQLLSGPLIELLFGLFFSSLLVMLTFSTGIIIYAGLFASREAESLLVLPISTDRIFAFKFQEAMFFSCWGFLLLASPLIIAYGVTAGARPYFYFLSAAAFVAFAFIPGSFGALVCLVVANFFPKRKIQILLTLAVLAVGAAGLAIFRAWSGTEGVVLSRYWLSGLIQQLRLSTLPFLPSHWVSRTLLSATYPDGLFDSFFYFLLLWSNSLFVYVVTAFAYRLAYRRGYDQVHSHRVSIRRRAAGTAWAFQSLLRPLPAHLRVLVLKDVRTFARDPLQWLQVLIFTGLLVLYVMTLSRMNYYTHSPYWRTMIAFFNLAVTGLILSTFTSRFIFPLLSLEGQKIWILGLAPISRASILWGKFAFAAGGSILVTSALTLISAVLLRLEPLLVLLQMVTLLILCFGISGISVGLGARFADTRETDPSRIAAGFGGTLNLVSSLLFLVFVIGMVAFPCHLYSVTLSVQQGTAIMDFGDFIPVGLKLERFRSWLSASIVASLVVGVLATLLPMRLGIRSFESREF